MTITRSKTPAGETPSSPTKSTSSGDERSDADDPPDESSDDSATTEDSASRAVVQFTKTGKKVGFSFKPNSQTSVAVAQKIYEARADLLNPVRGTQQAIYVSFVNELFRPGAGLLGNGAYKIPGADVIDGDNAKKEWLCRKLGSLDKLGKNISTTTHGSGSGTQSEETLSPFNKIAEKLASYKENAATLAVVEKKGKRAKKEQRMEDGTDLFSDANVASYAFNSQATQSSDDDEVLVVDKPTPVRRKGPASASKRSRTQRSQSPGLDIQQVLQSVVATSQALASPGIPTGAPPPPVAPSAADLRADIAAELLSLANQLSGPGSEHIDEEERAEVVARMKVVRAAQRAATSVLNPAAVHL
jgi:hypothetical protein